jgi:cytochrome P450
MTFVLAGFETTAATLMFAVYLLALHPEAQSRLHQELDAGREVINKKGVTGSVLTNGGHHQVAAEPSSSNGHINGGHNKGANEEGLNNEVLATYFPYACAIIDEALRLFPTGAGPVTSRVLQEDMDVLGHRCDARMIHDTAAAHSCAPVSSNQGVFKAMALPFPCANHTAPYCMCS